MKLWRYYLAAALTLGIVTVTPGVVKAEVAEQAVEAVIETESEVMEAAAETVEVGMEEETEAEAETETVTDAETAEIDLRQQLVDFSLQFLGGAYRYGGLDPDTGVDCSGFTRYVMKHCAGITLSHSSRAQAGEGREIDSSQMRPGDLIFYGSGKGINHVAMYIGEGQIVHASTKATGIKISRWNYRTPVRIVNVLGD